MKENPNLYVLHCNNCNYKRFSDGTDVHDLLQIKQSEIPRNIPKLDIIKKKAVNAPHKKRNKMFKCPKCGYTVKAYKIENKEEEINFEQEEVNNEDE